MDFNDFFFFFILRVNPKVIASLTYCMMSIKIYRQVEVERMKEKGLFSRAALAVSSGRKL